MNILITGGASGLGEAITRMLVLEKNNFVFFTYNKSEERAHNIEQEFVNSKAIKCDIENVEDIGNLINQMRQFDLQVLINNANAGFIKQHFHKIDTADFNKSFQSNVLPVIMITREAIVLFKKAKFGKIITILSSAIINVPPKGWSEYVAGKAYLLSLSKSWATEYANFNISSNCISPSFMQTGFTADIDERIVEEMIKNHPLKKLLTIREVAESVNFFTKSSQQINGVNLIINAANSID